MLAWIRSLAVLALLAGLAQPLAAQSAADEPAQVVDRLETTLIDHMKAGDSMEFQQRFERLRPMVEEIFAIDRMGRYLFGRDWQDLSEDERERFVDAFLDLSAATYAARFDEYGGEQFDAVEVQHQGEDRAVVRRTLTTGSGKQIAFDYLLTRDDDRWQIVTIITDGVSDLALKRSQYRSILDRDGFDAVIDYIREAVESQRGD